MTTLNSHPAKEGARLVKPRLTKPERHRDSEEYRREACYTAQLALISQVKSHFILKKKKDFC